MGGTAEGALGVLADELEKPNNNHGDQPKDEGVLEHPLAALVTARLR
jgi:hypothetical protein